jgi:4-amino-4-deoxy-L-arabinose transferase-like glycosyltransferase
MKTNRHTLRAICFSALILSIALSALFRLYSPRSYDGWIIAGALIAIYAFAVSHGPYVGERTALAYRRKVLRLSRGRRRRIFWTLGIVSLGASLGALLAFLQPGRGDWGWTLYLLAIVLLLAGIASLGNFGSLRGIQSMLRAVKLRGLSHWVLLALLLIAAWGVRVWQNGSLPFELWFDEARLGVVARRILTEPSYRPFFIEYMDRPAQHAMLTALSFGIFGANISSLRLVLALFGVLNVLMAYLLFGRWLGRVGGLVAAAVVLSMRYELTFSRIAFDANTTPFFMLLTLFFLDRGFHRRRASDFTLAGLAIGLGLSFYAPLRLFVLFLLALGLIGCAVVVVRKRSIAPLRALQLHILCMLFGFLTTGGPLLEFAATSPDVHFSRNQSVSIFNSHTEPVVAHAVLNSTFKHLGMFNYQGDRNGRHNLPYAPMLDPLSGFLFLLGVGLAARDVRGRPNLLMLGLFAVMLQAGIWSTEGDAPSAVRSIGVLPSLVYFIALALVTLHRDAVQWLKSWDARQATKYVPAAIYPRLKAFPSFALIAVLLMIALLNLDTYFNRQMVDVAIWMTHSIDDTWIGNEMNRLAATYDIALAADLSTSPTIQFLAPGVSPVRIWQYDDQLPLEPRGTRPVAILLNSTMASTVADARRIYPAAVITELRPPGGGEPIAYEILLDR